MGIIKKISLAASNQKSYQVGLLQTKAYRILKHKTTELLSAYKISSIEWAMLGLLADSKKGIRLIDLADELGVEPPFVSHMMAHLTKYGLIDRATDPADSRAKLALLTKSGQKFVTDTETYLRKEMKPMFNGASVSDLLGYLTVLAKIAENSD